jgi:DNA polymerase III epsilon subunit-like protein
MHYLAIDTETGGLEESASLLTAYFGYYSGMTLIDELYLELKPDDNLYAINPGALKINGIDLVKHHEKAISYKDAGTHLYQFLKRRYHEAGEKLTPVGQNVQWDIRRIIQSIIHPGTWGTFVLRRPIDVGCVTRFMSSLGKIPPEVGSLESIGKHFGLAVEGVHNAKVDATLSMEVLWALQRMVQP